jgi:hypothetical protein
MPGQTVQTVTDLGKLVKSKYPGQYDDLDDAVLGKMIKAKYPTDYSDFVEEAAKKAAGGTAFLAGATERMKETMAGVKSMATSLASSAAKFALLPSERPKVLESLVSDLATGIVTPMREQEAKSKEALKRGNKIEGYARRLGARIPIVGPLVAKNVEEIAKDPYKGAGGATVDLGLLLMCRGVGRAGKAIGARDIPPMAGPIPGAAPTALEARTGFLPTAGRMLAKSPIGTKPLSETMTKRNVAVTREAQGLLEAPPGSAEQTGLRAVGAVKAGHAAAKATEDAMWNSLKAAVAEEKITTPLTNTIRLAEPEYLLAIEAHDTLVSSLSRPTQQVLTQVNKRKQLLDTQNTLAQISGTSANMDMSMRELMAKLPPSARERIMEAQGITPPPDPSWLAVHQARTEIGQLLQSAKAKDPRGSPTTHALSKVYTGLSDDLAAALNEYPELQQMFEEASAATRAKHAMYGAPATLTERVMKAEPRVMPSQTISRLLAGTPESARNFVKAMDVTDPIAKQELAAGVIRKVLDKASGGKFGESTTILDGPAFAKQYLKDRPIIKELVDPDLLSRWDAFAKEVKSYKMTHGEAGEGTWARLASLAEYGAAATATGAAITGNVGAATGITVPLAASRVLVNILLQPEGPHLYARFLRTGKWAPELGKIVEASAYTSVLAPPPSATRKK